MTADRHIALDVLYLCLFHILRVIVELIQNVKWYFDGTRKEILQIRKEARYDRCAQLLEIKLKKHLDPMCMSNYSRHFIVERDTLVDPLYVLKNEVSLYYVDDNEAVFVEAPPGVEVWRNRYGAWHRLAQYKYAEKLIKVPLSAFYKLVENFEDPGEKLILLEFIPRTGSTLVCQLFEETEQIVTYAEPEVLLNPFDHMKHPEQMSKSSKEKLVKSVVKYMCRPQLITAGPTTAYMAKMPQCYFMKYKLLYSECFPKARFMFQYRNMDKTVYSLERTFPKLRMLHAYYFFLFWFSWFWRRNVILGCTYYMQNPDDKGLIDILMRTKQPEKLRYYVYYSSMMHFFLKQQDNVLNIPAIKYEDIMQNPRQSIEAIFDHCHIDRDLINKAMRAFGKDSQANSVLSRDRVKNGPTPVDKAKVHPDVYLDIKAVLQHFGVPEPDVDIRIANTITSP